MSLAAVAPSRLEGAVLWAGASSARRLPWLASFFPEATVQVGSRPGEASLVLGRPQDGGRPRALALSRGLAYVELSDGPACSLAGPGAQAPPISLFAHGSHSLDADLAAWLETARIGADQLEEAAGLIAFKRQHGLSRYCGGPSAPALAGLTDRPLVLVVDQPAGPAAPAVALALAAARTRHPQAQIVILRPPQGGRPHGWSLPAAALCEGDRVVEAQVDVMALIERSEGVFIADSEIGFDALLAGRPVWCFGAPFFAGWGLTQDMGLNAPRRGRTLSAEALFAGVCLQAARYVDPLTGQACSARQALERLSVFKAHALRVAGDWVGLNIPPPKHPVLRAFLAGPMSSYAPSPRWRRTSPQTARYAAWASKPNAAVRAVAHERPHQLEQIEDGFLRSVGLGSSFQPASSLVLDSRGIYYDPQRPSDLEVLLNTTVFGEALLARAAALRAAVVGLRLSKYNLETASPLNLGDTRGARKLLVPGQVEDDASVRTGGMGWTNLRLLQAVREANPDAFILFKEHPDVTAGNRVGRAPAAEAGRLADLQVRDIDIITCIEMVDEVHTLTSLTGFEALLRGKPVTTYGQPFYGGWGLTTDLQAYPRPRRALPLDALVAGALLLYPLYLDPVSRLPCDPETLVARLEMLKANPPPAQHTGLRGQLRRAWRATVQSIAAPRPPIY